MPVYKAFLNFSNKVFYFQLIQQVSRFKLMIFKDSTIKEEPCDNQYFYDLPTTQSIILFESLLIRCTKLGKINFSDWLTAYLYKN